MPIRVLLVDDHVLVREGLRHILERDPEIEVIGEASDGEEALELANELQPDVVLMDLTMPRLGGLEATDLLRQRQPDVHVLVLTMHEGYDYFFQALQSGASGYVLKGASGEDVRAAIRAVHAGDVYIHPAIAKQLVGDYLNRIERGESLPEYDGLTTRERQVLRLVAEGLTTPQIAERLTLSPNTVNTHRQHVMQKLNLHNRAELIRYAVRKGFVRE